MTFKTSRGSGRVVLSGVLFLAALSVQPVPVCAQMTTAPTLIPVSGWLTDAGGGPRTGPVLLVLSLYEQQDDPTPMWIEHQQVQLGADGSYRVYVGANFDDGLPSYLFGDNGARFVGVAVENEAEHWREPLVAVPYASRAVTADTLGGQTLTELLLTESFQTSLTSALQEPALKGVLKAAGAPSIAGAADDGTVSATNLVSNGDALLGSETEGALLVRSTGATSAVLRPSIPNGSLLISDDSQLVTRGITVQSGGRVGIGTATPRERLHVTDANQNKWGAFVEQTNATASNGLLVQTRTASAGDAALLVQSEGGVRPLLMVRNNGNVGVGTQTPAFRLDVNGAARLGSSSTGAVYVKSTGATSALIRPAVQNGSLMISDDSELVSRGLTIANGGRVGIVTATPTSRLDVAGSVHVSGDMVVDGNIGAKYQDVAEWVDSPQVLSAGTVVSIDPEAPNRVVAAATAYDSRVAGAVSAQPGVILGVGGAGRVLVSHSGRVRIKADARFGAIRIGDLLASSPTPGHAMRADGDRVRPGTVLGKALESLPSGQGDVLALLTLQ